SVSRTAGQLSPLSASTRFRNGVGSSANTFATASRRWSFTATSFDNTTGSSADLSSTVRYATPCRSTSRNPCDTSTAATGTRSVTDTTIVDGHDRVTSAPASWVNVVTRPCTAAVSTRNNGVPCSTAAFSRIRAADTWSLPSTRTVFTPSNGVNINTYASTNTDTRPTRTPHRLRSAFRREGTPPVRDLPRGVRDRRRVVVPPLVPRRPSRAFEAIEPILRGTADRAQR